MNRFQKVALIAFLCVELLMFVGAVVRATGSGLGCPDWPFCYGCWLPPSSAAEINREALEKDLPKFKIKAERLGRDAEKLTVDQLVAEYDPVSTWIEYFNRLTALPVGVSVLALAVYSFFQRRPSLVILSLLSLALVGVNAWLGRNVVLSRLNPGTITLHMALAVLLLCCLVYVAWAGARQPWRIVAQKKVLPVKVGWALFAFIVIEGVMGSQVRELTDSLALSRAGQSRASWIPELEGSVVYLIHRSFSWLLLVLAVAFARGVVQSLGRLPWLELSVVGIVFAQMVLGVVLSHFGVFPLVQVLHVGLSSLLVSGLFLWLLGAKRRI
jgi:heme a synthase